MPVILPRPRPPPRGGPPLAEERKAPAEDAEEDWSEDDERDAGSEVSFDADAAENRELADGVDSRSLGGVLQHHGPNRATWHSPEPPNSDSREPLRQLPVASS